MEMIIYGRFIKYGLLIYDHIWSIARPRVPTYLLHRPALFALHVRIDPQAQRQRLARVQLHQRLQNLGVHVFRRFIRPDILFAVHPSSPTHSPPDFLCRAVPWRPARNGSACPLKTTLGSPRPRRLSASLLVLSSTALAACVAASAPRRSCVPAQFPPRRNPAPGCASSASAAATLAR